mmetsp:Transcript_53329/g.172116  ORF Transcript_53329/g.172116 Transcript_53329/m.172116 type:complete len:257 (-) Transcript_53329:1305-2075(-)
MRLGRLPRHSLLRLNVGPPSQGLAHALADGPHDAEPHLAVGAADDGLPRTDASRVAAAYTARVGIAEQFRGDDLPPPAVAHLLENGLRHLVQLGPQDTSNSQGNADDEGGDGHPPLGLRHVQVPAEDQGGEEARDGPAAVRGVGDVLVLGEMGLHQVHCWYQEAHAHGCLEILVLVLVQPQRPQRDPDQGVAAAGHPHGFGVDVGHHPTASSAEDANVEHESRPECAVEALQRSAHDDQHQTVHEDVVEAHVRVLI